MVPRAKIAKILYYKDLWFLLRTFITSLRISLLCFFGKGHLLLPLISTKNIKYPQNQDKIKQNRPLADSLIPLSINPYKIKIIRYVNLSILLCRKLGIKDTCFTRSLLLSYMLRQAGFGARINFGAKKKNGEFIGHCWVNQNKNEDFDYNLVFSYP